MVDSAECEVGGVGQDLLECYLHAVDGCPAAAVDGDVVAVAFLAGLPGGDLLYGHGHGGGYAACCSRTASAGGYDGDLPVFGCYARQCFYALCLPSVVVGYEYLFLHDVVGKFSKKGLKWGVVLCIFCIFVRECQ